MKEKTNKLDKQTLLLAQEINFAKSLASNSKKVRDRALKALKKWLQLRLLKMPFTEKDFMLLWKGLFYSMWMSDKMLVQEECAESISALIHFPTWENSLLFYKCGLQTLIDSWFGIDQLRLDKFAMFVRRFLRQSLVVLANENWDQKVIEKYNEILSETVLNPTKLPPLGLAMHFIEIYMEEVAKVSRGRIGASVTTLLLKPFIKHLVVVRDTRLTSHNNKFVFRHLMWQSDLGADFKERYGEWRNRGFPAGTIDVIQKEELSDDEVMLDDEASEEDDSNKPLDPRAGHVDVELPQIPIDPREIVETLKTFRFIKDTTTRNRRILKKVIGEYEKLSSGEFPLGTKEVTLIKRDPSITIKKSVKRMLNFEKKIMGESGKRKRKKDIKENNEETSLEEVPKKKKKTKIRKNDDDLQNKLDQFIEKSESHLLKEKRSKKNITPKKSSDLKEMNKVLTKRKKLATNLYKSKKVKTTKLKRQTVVSNGKSGDSENCFQRNSGTWYVCEVQPSEDNNSTVESIKSDEKETTTFKIPTIISENVSEIINTEETSKRIQVEIKKEEKLIQTSTPIKTDAMEVLFSKSEWDFPPREGEIEIFVPSKKYREKQGPNNNNTVPNVIKKSIMRGKGIKKDANMVRNPFSSLNLTGSGKKVKIALNLNKSQEIHEHLKMLQSSPAIPFDAEKKPSKPLLKKPVVASPINPFYKHKLSL